ncbi:MAG: hypothetical protein HY791_06345 [Deltaproteobacteria bacterium]|nr:hypothetical protein [Deltaproteobacteria bacterium]
MSPEGKIVYSELVADQSHEPNYDADRSHHHSARLNRDGPAILASRPPTHRQ